MNQKVTKIDLKNEISSLDARVDIKFGAFFLKMQDMMKEFRNDIFTKLDQVMGELEQIREDNLSISDKLFEQEKRVKKIEKQQTTN
jgi:hypothetical protein